MRRDHKRRRKSAKFKSNNAQNRWPRIFAGTLVLAIISTGGFYLWMNRSAQIDTSGVVASFHRFSGWMTAHRNRLNQKIVKVKQLAVAKTDEPIHFEFYS